jgi:hypothetical protein
MWSRLAQTLHQRAEVLLEDAIVRAQRGRLRQQVVGRLVVAAAHAIAGQELDASGPSILGVRGAGRAATVEV